MVPALARQQSAVTPPTPVFEQSGEHVPVVAQRTCLLLLFLPVSRSAAFHDTTSL